MATGARIDSDGLLVLNTDPGVWIQNNPDYLLLVRKLQLDSLHDAEEIGESIGELTQLIRLDFHCCSSLKCVPANVGQMKSLTYLDISGCYNIKSLPMSLANLRNLETLHIYDCESLTQLPVNLKASHLKLDSCCNLNLPRGLRNLKYLSVTVCSCSHQSFENLKDSDSLQHLVILGCHTRHNNNIIKLPASFNQLVNLQFLSLLHNIRFVELPANLNGLAKLCGVDIQGSDIKCLPWSITALGSLRLLMLPFDFRLHILPSELNDQVIISVNRRHVRKTWKEIKEEISFSEVRLKMAMGAPQHSSIIFPSGYLRLRGDPGPWIQSNYDSLMLVQILELEDLKKRISRSTMKRRLKDLNRKWPSRKKGKQRLDDAQKRKQNSKAPFGSNSTQQKLVNPTNSTAHAEIVGECIMGANQLTLPNHVSSNSNAVGNLTVVIVRENLMDAQGDMDSQHGEEHLDGANDQGHLEGILHSAESNLAATLETLEEPLMVTERHMDTQQQAKGHLDGALRSTESSGTIIVKATYKELSVRIVFPLTLTINQLIEEIGMKFQLEVNKYRLLYQDEDKEWMMLTCVEDLKYASNVAESLGTKFVRLSVIDYVV